MKTRSLFLKTTTSLLVIAAFTIFAGCEDDACKVGDSQCLTDTLIRTCIKNDDKEPTWKVYACPSGTECVKAEPTADGSGGSGGADGADNADADAGADEDGADAGADEDGAAADGAGNSNGAGRPAVAEDQCVEILICEDGVAECVTAELSRYCVGGTEWALDPCGVGEICDDTDGRCKLAESTDEDFVKLCNPGETACVSEDWEKVCDPDGSDWRLQACLPWEICSETEDGGGECQPDPDQSCDPTGGVNSGFCVDATTAARCSAITGGYELVSCPDGTYCINGRCRGENCAIGSVCLAPVPVQPDNPAAALPAQILQCVDGVNQKIIECDIGQVCRQNGDQAECVDPVCVPGTAVCGHPDDETVDATRFYSTCVVGTVSNVPEWVLTECDGRLVCDPTLGAGVANLCRSECTPGAQVCAQDAGRFVVSGWRECQDDGTWGDITSCTEENSAQLVCMNKLDQEPGASNQVVCADPVCAAIAANPAPPVDGVEAVQGVCEGAQIRTCDENGKLQEEAVDCETGVCRNDLTLVTPLLGDGQIRGTCDVQVDCEEGESICLGSGANPLYQNCVDGVWGTELVRCEDDHICWDSVNEDGLRQASCGGDCSPGSTRCDDDEFPPVHIQVCDENGEWQRQQICEFGICQVVTVNNAWQALCMLECEPDREYCNTAGATKLADDGRHDGWEQVRTCRPDGVWPDPTDSDDDGYFADCPNVRTCRVSSAGVHTGCIECLGPDVAGGNEHGFTDTTCEDDMFKACGSNNRWQDPEECGGSTSCVPPAPVTNVCGSCLSGAGVTLAECSQALINDTEICGSCTSAGGNPVDPCTNTSVDDDPAVCDDCLMPDTVTTAQCTDANIATYGGTDCAIDGHTGSSAWGGVADCCIDSQSGTGPSDCLSVTGFGYTDWGGETECCFTAQQGTTSTCASEGYGFPGTWGGVADCCSSYWLTTPAQDFAVCL